MRPLDRPWVVGITFALLLAAGAWVDGEVAQATTVQLCEDAASPEASVTCPDLTLPLVEPVARTSPVDRLPFTGFDITYLFIGLGAAAAVVIGTLVIVYAKDHPEDRP